MERKKKVKEQKREIIGSLCLVLVPISEWNVFSASSDRNLAELMCANQ